VHPHDQCAGDDRERVAARIDEVFHTGASEVEAAFTTRAGERSPHYYFNGVRTQIDGQLCLLGMGIDISESKRAHEALRAADERVRLAAAAAKIGLWDWDLATDRVFYSPEWKAQIGYAEHEIGDHLDEWRQRVHPDDLEAAEQRMFAFVAEPTHRYHAEFRLRHRDGSYRWILSQAALCFDEHGRPIRMLGWHVDVTDQRQLEDQLQHARRMEAVGQLAGGLAHDFNNFLTVINGNTGLLLDDLPPGDPARELLEEIHRAGASAADLTRRLLAVSRQQVLEPTFLDLNAVLADLEPILRRLAGRAVELTIRSDPGLGTVHADRAQLEQVVVNLVVNARDAMAGGGLLVIETANVDGDDATAAATDHVALVVTDTGTGIDDALLPRVFEPFFTTKGVGEGTGLGLATVHGIVTQSGGQISVDSERGRGTRITVRLPRVAAHGAAPAETATGGRAARSGAPGPG
jgi:PAS domain S-box-containing protein